MNSAANMSYASAPLPALQTPSEEQIEPPSVTGATDAVTASTQDDPLVPPATAKKLLSVAVQQVQMQKEPGNLLIAAIATALRRCLEEGEPGSGLREPTHGGNGSYRIMKAMALTMALLQQPHTTSFRTVAGRELTPAITALTLLECEPPSDTTPSDMVISRVKLKAAAMRLLRMLEYGVSSVVNHGDMKVAARHQRVTNVDLSPGQSVRWRFELVKHDIGLTIDVQNPNVSKQCISGPLKLMAGAANAATGEYSRDSSCSSVDSSRTQVTFIWDNTYSKLNTKTIHYEMEVTSPLGAITRPQSVPSHAAAKVASLAPPPNLSDEEEGAADAGHGTSTPGNSMGRVVGRARSSSAESKEKAKDPFPGKAKEPFPGALSPPLNSVGGSAWGRVRGASMGLSNRTRSGSASVLSRASSSIEGARTLVASSSAQLSGFISSHAMHQTEAGAFTLYNEKAEETARLDLERTETWRKDVLPHWGGSIDTPERRELLELGVPEAVRPAVWSAATAAAKLGMSRSLYEAVLLAVSDRKQEEAAQQGAFKSSGFEELFGEEAELGLDDGESALTPRTSMRTETPKMYICLSTSDPALLLSCCAGLVLRCAALRCAVLCCA